MRALDSNVLVRLITRDDPAQVATAERFIENGAWVSSVALAETVWVLESVYDLRPSGIASAVEMLLNLEQVVLQDVEAVACALQIFRERPALGFADCLLLELARKSGHLPFGTFDRSLSKLSGAQKLH